MRNLKKFLALVLAMMMTFSLMITVNAASKFSDADSITTEFDEAIKVLEGLKVFEGYPDKTFKPKNDITRAEAATIVYRLATGDVEGNKAHLYKDYATFTDVTSDHWAAGYINYCANAQWIAGYGNGKFGPNDKVTGYQAAAMILRAVGYGKNNEFKGSTWQVQAANFSRTLGLLKNVNNTTYANTLNQPATRELVAEILFQAGLIDTVTWTPVFGYQSGDNSIQGQSNTRGLAWQNFELNVTDWAEIDDWGRPGYYWIKDNNADHVVATIELEPVLDLEEKAWKECEVAEALKISTTRDYDLFVNSNAAITNATNKYRIEATDTVTNVGGQGRVTEFYATTEHPWNDLYTKTNWKLNQRVIMIDTYLATVTNVTERVLDPAGHVIVPAYLYLDVYEGERVGASDKTAAATHNTSEHRLSDYSANWTYVKGDKVLVQGWTDKSVGVDHRPSAGIDAVNKAAFETNRLKSSGNGGGVTNYPNDDSKTCTAANFTNISVVKKAEPKIAKQTVTYWSQDKHTVDGADYFDAITLFLDVAGTTTNSNFAWYFDEYNNIIGIDNVPDTVHYGVITSIYSAFGQGDSVTDGTAKAIATVKYANGDTGTITIDRFLVNTAAAVGGHYAPVGAVNTTNAMLDTTGTVTSANLGAGVANLVPVYDNSIGSNVMSATVRGDAATKVSNAQYAGWLHVAPVASINAAMDNNTTNYGVILGNMFKFVASANGSMTAIEVSGKVDGTHANENTGIFEWNYNGAATGTNGRLYKNYSYIGLNGGANADVRLDTDAYIMVKTGATSVLCLTPDTLTGDVILDNNSEVDWADPDGDGRAEYVYVSGSIEGTETYGLFYYNGGAAQWDGSTGTMFGWLNGEPTTLTFAGSNAFNAVKNSQTYKGHLFAVRMTNGVVTNVLNQAANATYSWLLYDYAGSANTTGTTITNFGANVQVGTTGTFFGLGSVNSKFGNPYTATTEAIYLNDSTGNSNVTYDPSTRTVTVAAGLGAGTYYLNAGTKVVGLGMGVNQDGAILDYLNKSTSNDVTIVYEQNAVKSIVEIYVATDPNVTPPPTGTTFKAVTASGGTTAQTLGINLTSGTIAPKATTWITKNGTDYTTPSGFNVDVTAVVEKLTDNGYVVVGTYEWTEAVAAAGTLGTTGITLSLNTGLYRVNASISNTTIGTLNIAVNQVISVT